MLKTGGQTKNCIQACLRALIAKKQKWKEQYFGNLINVYLVSSKKKLIASPNYCLDGGNTVFIHYFATADPIPVPLPEKIQHLYN